MDVMLYRIMNIPVETLIETGLNVVGYLAAGGLLLMISDYMRNRGGRTESAKTKQAPLRPSETVPGAGSKRPSPSFVSFADPGKAAATDGDTSTQDEPAPDGSRRNRAEVIELARRMIAARESREAITNKLPISEAELAMLTEQ